MPPANKPRNGPVSIMRKIMNRQEYKRQLGNSELMISPIGLGTWQFSKRKNLAGKYWPMLSDEKSYQIVQTSYNNGVNWFDTAEMYGNGESERTLARALHVANIPDENVVVATKWMPIFRTAGSIHKTIGQRIDALDGYTISLYQIHNPFSFSGIRAQMQAMADLVKDKKIRYVGVSNFSAAQMRKAHWELSRHGIQLISNQVHYNMVNRSIEDNGVLETARKLNVSIIAYSPLAQGILTGKYHDAPGEIKSKKGFRKRIGSFKEKGLEKTRPLVDRLRKTAENHNSTAAQVALNWLTNYHGGMVFAIPGASNAQQAESNARSMALELTGEEMKTLDQASKQIQK